MTYATVTIELTGWRAVAQPWESTLLEHFRLILPQYSILAIDRPLFSGRYAVTLDSKGASHERITHDFLRALQDMDFTGEVVAVDSGGASSNPGGLLAATSDTLTTTSQAASGLLIPAAVIAVAVLVIIYFPKPRS